MDKRFISIWFRYLTTDWLTIRRPALQGLPLIFAASDHGRKVVTAANAAARAQGIAVHMSVADAQAIVPELNVFDDQPGRELKLLKAIGEWCMRYTPIVAIDTPDGLFLDISGCAHLWGGERAYLKEIVTRLRSKGYDVRAAIADTVGTAWAIARFGEVTPIINSGEQIAALLPLPASALRLEHAVLQKLQKLGLYQIRSFISMPRSVLRRRFGEGLLLRISQAIGKENELITPLQFIEPYQERLPCLEPIRNAKGIEIAIKMLLEALCKRLQGEGKGLRIALLECYRVDGKMVHADIGTNLPSHDTGHLFKLFDLKIPMIAPALGIELFIMEALKVEDLPAVQEALWAGSPGLHDQEITQLLDRLTVKLGPESIHRYLPDEHYWPERSIRTASSMMEIPSIIWRTDKPRPTQLLTRPELIQVTAPIPDYPPMLFIYKGKTHQIKKSDGPERIEREWWLEAGEHRDYYQVEDEDGQRYWIFRSGHYAEDKSNRWFIHGFFA